MKKILMPLLIIFLIITEVRAQESVNGDFDLVILGQADMMGKLFLAKDYESFAKFTHPATVELMGGMENMLIQTKAGFEQLEAEGIEFLSIKFTAPSQIILHEGEMQCTLTQIIEMKVKGGIMTIFPTVIAVSRDNGKNWYFVDTAGNDLKNMRKLIITLSPLLVLPEPMDAAFVPDPETKP